MAVAMAAAMSEKRPLERRQLTVMLCDLVDSTALSTRLDAEALTEVIQRYRQRCAGIINRHGGFVAQYVGDGISAYFGYPRAHEDDAERALRAALDIVKSAGQPPSRVTDADVHIGIATGVMVVGDLADDAQTVTNSALVGRAEVSAIGSALNLAARLQGLAPPAAVVVSEQTRRLTRGIFEYSDMGQHNLKGFDAPIQAWRVMGESSVQGRFHALRTSALTPLVGRQTELRKLRDIWSSVEKGQGRAVLLSSDPGVGKSRLSEEVSTQIADRRCLRLWYYCSPHLHSTPLAPLVRQLAQGAGLVEADATDLKLRKIASIVPATADASMEIVPLLASLLSVPYQGQYPPLQMSVQREKQQLFQVLMHLLQIFASRRPVLVVIEDLHWVDPSTDELIGVLIDRLKELPILLLLTARPEFQSHWDDKAQLVHMPLVPLERSESIAMIELLCAARNIPAPTVRQIADRTDGLPLFIEDLTRDMLELAALEPAPGAGADQGTRSALAVPATLTDSLMARLDRLGSAKRVAQIGAVIGREFSYELLSKVSEFPEESLKEELYRLVESGMLLRGRSTDVLTHVFKHALVRDAAYFSLLKKEQAVLHARIAKALIDDFPETAKEEPERLANHLEAAGDNDRAVPYLLKAAELSARRSGFVEAITLLKRGLALLQAKPVSVSRMRQELALYMALGDINAEYRGFSASDCGEAYAKALALCRELDDDGPEIFSVLSCVSSFQITRAMFAECRAAGEECLSRAAGQSSKPPFVMGHRILGGTSFLTGDLVAARRHLEQALAFHAQDETPYREAQVLYVQDQKSTVLCYLALTLSILGYPDSGLRAAEDSLRHSHSVGDPHTVNFSLCFLAAVLHVRRDSQRALQVATESLDLAREQGFATWIGISQMIRGASLAHNGKCADGLLEIRAGMTAHSQMAAGAYQPFGISLLVEGLIIDGRLDEALAALTQALAIGEKSGERFYVAELLRLNAQILAAQGKLADAESWLRRSLEVSRRQQAKLFGLRSATDLCQLLQTPQREAMLFDTLEPTYRWFEEGFNAHDLRRARAMLTANERRSR
jgi:class 3 adenylate cyclase/tetratricopeptide (TPR) repeat protein